MQLLRKYTLTAPSSMHGIIPRSGVMATDFKLLVCVRTCVFFLMGIPRMDRFVVPCSTIYFHRALPTSVGFSCSYFDMSAQLWLAANLVWLLLLTALTSGYHSIWRQLKPHSETAEDESISRPSLQSHNSNMDQIVRGEEYFCGLTYYPQNLIRNLLPPQ